MIKKDIIENNFTEKNPEDIIKRVSNTAKRQVEKKREDATKKEIEKVQEDFIQKMIRDYNKLEDKNVDLSEELAMLKWGAYSKKEIIQKIEESLQDEIQDEDIEQIKEILKEKGNIRKLEFYYYDILRKYNKIDSEIIEKTLFNKD